MSPRALPHETTRWSPLLRYLRGIFAKNAITSSIYAFPPKQSPPASSSFRILRPFRGKCGKSPRASPRETTIGAWGAKPSTGVRGWCVFGRLFIYARPGYLREYAIPSDSYSFLRVRQISPSSVRSRILRSARRRCDRSPHALGRETIYGGLFTDAWLGYIR